MMLFLYPVCLFAVESQVEGTNETVKFTIGQKNYYEGNKKIKTDVAPYVKSLASGGGRTMVPVAFVAPALGTEAPVWQPEERTVKIKKGEKQIEITIVLPPPVVRLLTYGAASVFTCLFPTL
jgi:hypothetical protein